MRRTELPVVVIRRQLDDALMRVRPASAAAAMVHHLLLRLRALVQPDGRMRGRLGGHILRLLRRRRRLLGQLLRRLEVDARRVQLLVDRLDTLLGRTDHGGLRGQFGRRLTGRLLRVLRRRLRIVEGRRQNGQMVHRLLRGLLGRLGAALRLLQLLDLAVERLMGGDVLLFETLQQHLLTGERGLRGGGRLTGRLRQLVLGHVGGLLAGGVLTVDGRAGLIGGALGDGAQAAAGTVALLVLVEGRAGGVLFLGLVAAAVRVVVLVFVVAFAERGGGGRLLRRRRSGGRGGGGGPSDCQIGCSCVCVY